MRSWSTAVLSRASLHQSRDAPTVTRSRCPAAPIPACGNTLIHRHCRSEALFSVNAHALANPKRKPDAKRLCDGGRGGRCWPDAATCSTATRPCPSARPAPARTAAWPAGQAASGEVQRLPCSRLPWRAANAATPVWRVACDSPGSSSRVSQPPFPVCAKRPGRQGEPASHDLGDSAGLVHSRRPVSRVRGQPTDA